MDHKTTPNEISVAIEHLCSLATECWRLQKIGAEPAALIDKKIVRHIGRRIAEALQAIGLESLDMTGRAYDSGMAPEVIEVINSDRLDGGAIVDETVSPIVTWKGQVLQPGQIIVRQGFPRN